MTQRFRHLFAPRAIRFVAAALALTVIVLVGHSATTQAAGPVPVDVRVTDVTDTSAVISWRTTAATTGAIRLWKCSDPSTVALYLDKRDAGQSTPTTASTIHYIRLPDRALDPVTAYCYDVMSGNTTYDNGGQPYAARTGPALSVSTPVNVIAKMRASDGSPARANSAVVYVRLVDADGRDSPGISTMLSSLILDDLGDWSVSLGTARTADLSGSFSYSTGDKLRVDVFSADGLGGLIFYPAPTEGTELTPPLTLGPAWIYRQFLPALAKVKTTEW